MRFFIYCSKKWETKTINKVCEYCCGNSIKDNKPYVFGVVVSVFLSRCSFVRSLIQWAWNQADIAGASQSYTNQVALLILFFSRSVLREASIRSAIWSWIRHFLLYLPARDLFSTTTMAMMAIAMLSQRRIFFKISWLCFDCSVHSSSIWKWQMRYESIKWRRENEKKKTNVEMSTMCDLIPASDVVFMCRKDEKEENRS